jgi:hypothetical protein
MTCKCTPVGLQDIAQRMGVPENTVRVWHTRRVLPEARWRVSGRPAWDFDKDILPWAKKTGRLSSSYLGLPASTDRSPDQSRHTR